MYVVGDLVGAESQNLMICQPFYAPSRTPYEPYVKPENHSRFPGTGARLVWGAVVSV